MQRNILEYLEHTVKRVPDKTAFANGEMGMSFQEVFDASRSIGTCLLEKGYEKEPIVIYMKKHHIDYLPFGVWCIVAVFMCLWMKKCRRFVLN